MMMENAEWESAMFGISWYRLLWYFLIFSFLGWVIEVIYHAVKMGKIINRGFLNGPVCPVYGFGMDTVLVIGSAVSQIGSSAGTSAVETMPFWELFLFGVAFATLVELIAGWLLDVLFHARWWDYSQLPLNFHGYICLEFSLIWGLAIVLVVREIYPLVKSSVSSSPGTAGWIVMAVLYALLFTDLAVTVSCIVGFNKRIRQLDDLRKSMRTVSDKLTETVGESSIKTAQKIQGATVQASLGRAALREAAQDVLEEGRLKVTISKAEWEEQLSKSANKVVRRLMEAFPNLQMDRPSDSFDALKEWVKSGREAVRKEKQE